MQRVTLKTSTIFIAKGNKTRVYYSVGEVPRELRKELEESTNGFNSATILIADRRGREEIRRALNGLPSMLRTRLASSLPAAGSEPQSHPRPQIPGLHSIPMKLRWAVGLAIPAAATLLWFFLGQQ